MQLDLLADRIAGLDVEDRAGAIELETRDGVAEGFSTQRVKLRGRHRR